MAIISEPVVDVLKKHHDQFDVIWNRYGTESHRLICSTMSGRELINKLSEWHVEGQELIDSLNRQID